MYKTKNPWVVCLAASYFFFFQFVQISMFNVLKPYLLLELPDYSAALNVTSSMYFLGNGLSTLPIAIMLDQYSTRKLMLGTIIFTLIGVCLTLATKSIVLLTIGRFMIGFFGGALSFVGAMRLATRWFAADQMAFVTGIIIAIGMLGGIVAQTPFNLLIESIGLHNALLCNVVFCLSVLLVLYLFIVDYPPEAKQLYLAETTKAKKSIWQDFKQVITNSQNWYSGLFIALLNLPLMILGALWGVMYLTKVFGLDAVQSSLTCTALFVGMLFGAPIFGWISDHFGNRRIPMLAGLLICLSALLIVLNSVNLNFYQLTALFLLIGFGSGVQTLGYPVISESNPLSIVGTAFGIASVLVMMFAALFQPIIGWIIEKRQAAVDLTLVSEQAKTYLADSYQNALMLLPLAILVAGFMLWRLKETYCTTLSKV